MKRRSKRKNHFHTSKKQGRSYRGLGAEFLEHRRLLAIDTGVTWKLTNGVMLVSGTANNNTLGVKYETGTAWVERGGGFEDTSFPVASIVRIQVNGNEGNDTIDIDASIGAVVAIVNGNAGDDLITTLNTGNNQINGGTGSDTITAGVGNDTITANDNEMDVISAGAGDDLIRGDELDLASLDAGMGNRDAFYLMIASGPNTVDLNLINVERYYGSELFADVIDASSLPVRATILGRGGNDTITGSAFNDQLIGGDGDDSIDGGDGPDSINGDDTASGTGNDTLIGGGGDDIIRGHGGNDNISGGLGNDELFGDTGDDIIEGGAGADRMSAGTSGVDTLSYASSTVGVSVNLATEALSGGDATGDVLMGIFENLTGGSGDDVLQGTDAANVIHGGAGNDSIFGRGGNDSLFGDENNDLIRGNLGLDAMSGGDGDDTIYAEHEDNTNGANISGGNGLDYVRPDTGSLGWNFHFSSGDFEVVVGTNFDDIISVSGSPVAVNITGVGGNDTLTGGSANDTISGGNGNDVISGGGGNDTLNGDNDNDTLNGDGGNDRLTGGAGIDVLNGGADDDLLFMDAADDPDGFAGPLQASMTGGSGSDTLDVQGTIAVNLSVNGWGFEIVRGSGGNDIISNAGSTLAITIQGRNGNDTLVGGAAIDRLEGGNGDDFLDGGEAIGGGDDAVVDILRGDANIDTAFDRGVNDSLVAIELIV